MELEFVLTRMKGEKSEGVKLPNLPDSAASNCNISENENVNQDSDCQHFNSSIDVLVCELENCYQPGFGDEDWKVWLTSMMGLCSAAEILFSLFLSTLFY